MVQAVVAFDGLARALPQALAEHAIERVVSSPHARCVETVEALARSRNLRVELRDELLPDASEAGDVGDWLDGFVFALAGPIYAGTNEIQRNIIAERILGLPRK